MLIDGEGVTLSEALRRNRRKNPSKHFIRAHDSALTYEEVSRLTAGFAEFLLSSGAKRGGKVCLLLPRIPELIVAFLGAVRIGAIPVPVNFTLGRENVLKFVASVSPVVTVVHEKILSQYDLDVSDCFGGTVVVGAERAGCIPWRRACSPSDAEPCGETGYDELAYLNFTTGASGVPKGALATHANIRWNTKSAVEVLGIAGSDIHLCMFAPFAHPHELFARALYTGGTTVLLEEINPKTIAKTIRDQGVTCLMSLAPMYDMLISHCAASGLGRLRIAESGGMYTRPDIAENFRRHFGIPVLSVWGSTETTGIALANTPTAFRTDGSMGRVCPHYGVRIVDEEGRDVDDGVVGEMLFSGPGVVAAYLGDVAFPTFDGCYRSGDLARRDAEGYHYFVERTSGLLKVAGLKVYPLQVELAIQAHPAVKEAAVIGIEDRRRGAVPKAFVIVNEGCRIDSNEIRRFCRDRLADYMIPKEVQVVGEFPRIGSGKIDKMALKAEWGSRS